MATNQDFNNLVVRIDTATDTLEVATGIVVDAGSNVAQDALEAQAAATTATTQAGIATTNATQATLAATTTTQQATIATTQATEAKQAVLDAKALAPFNEAPKDGQIYGRTNATWQVVDSGGGGIGTVTSVNSVTPDGSGNVEITIPTPVEQVQSDWDAVSGKGVILNKPDVFSGNYADLAGKPSLFNGTYSSLTGKPTIPTTTNELYNNSDFVTDAPIDVNQYARSGGAWVLVEASGGDEEATGFPIVNSGLYYNSVLMETWRDVNPNGAILLSELGAYVNGEFYTGSDFFSRADGLEALPSGRYAFGNYIFTGTLETKKGYIDVVSVPNSGRYVDETATAYVLDTDNKISETYAFNPTTLVWSKNEAEVVEPVPQEPATLIVNKRTGETFEEWIGTQAQYDAVSVKDDNVRYWITEV